MKKLIASLMVIVLLAGCGVAEEKNPYEGCDTWEELLDVVFSDEFEMMESIPSAPLVVFKDVSDIDGFMNDVSTAVQVISDGVIDDVPVMTTLSIGAGVTLKMMDDGSTQIDVQGSFEGADRIVAAYHERFG